MTHDFMLLVAQTATLFFITAWLTTGVLENIVYPDLNGTFTAEVLSMARMAEEYPEAYARVSYRRVEDPVLQKRLFQLIVGWELIATIALWIGTFALAGALLFGLDRDLARGLGLLGSLFFTSTWAGFLVAGNWFCYWFCHEGAQNTHFQMTLWGFATMILLSLG